VNEFMARKPPTNIPKLVAEVLIAATPVIIELVSKALEKRGKRKSAMKAKALAGKNPRTRKTA
jgi:energy-coupling factor transporter transmembrane protein EcfT